ncbi:diphthine methyl ester synthase-like [Actinia tenebrosa]|uniref:diphthine methyl ester synthase n=1 Tax=Actinia tenebrosa TaxID=6105 RepID=A0A6P8HUE3_ACTTE|nr:diphthine methyl ester synthase-like [Actinia tenebrosa]
MLYLIGLGLGDAKDISVRGLEVVKKAKSVFLEAYTSILSVDKLALEELYGREVILADRELVEQQADIILQDAKSEDVAFLVVGDPFGATTHTDLVIRAREQNIPYKVLHNASILNAVGCCGLQLYNYGETVSIVFWTDDWKPDSFYDKIAANRKRGLHTLCLLDIKVKEQSVENLMRGRKIYEPPRYMTVSEAVKQLLEVPKLRNLNKEEAAYDETTLAVGLARIGSNEQQVVFGTMKSLLSHDLGPPLHSLVVPGEMHFLEKEMLYRFAVDINTDET